LQENQKSSDLNLRNAGSALGSATIAHGSPAALGFVGAAPIVAGLILMFAITPDKRIAASVVPKS
jgi:predicted MFS family arabinose efflux permease